MVAQVESSITISPSPRNRAETDPQIGTMRLAVLRPYALARLGRVVPDVSPKKCWSVRRDIAELKGRLCCGAEQVFKFVRVICDKGPENVRGTDLLKNAPCGGKGKMKIKPHLRELLATAIQVVCVKQGMKPGHRRTTRAVLDHMQAAGAKKNELPSRVTVVFHCKQPAILVKRAALIEGEHMVRVAGSSDDVFAINQCVHIDVTTFSSGDNVEDIVYVFDDQGRLLGILNVIFGLDVATRGVWTYLPIVGSVNSFLVGLAIRRGLLPKESLLEKFGIRGTYPYCGKPREIKHDCGSEFLSEHTKRVLVDIDIQFVDVCPPETPYYRAKDERFHRIAHAHFAEFVRSDIGRRYLQPVPGKPKAVGIRFSDVDRALLEWIVCDYHNGARGGLGGQTPLQRFEMAANGRNGMPKCGYPVPLEDTKRLLWDFLWEVPRVIGHTGIHAFNRTYRDSQLSLLFAPGKRSSRRRLSVRANPYALGSVFVRVPTENGDTSIISVPWLRESEKFPMDANTVRAASNPSYWEWKAIYSDLRRAGKQSPTPAEAEELASKRELEAEKARGSGNVARRVRGRERGQREMRRHFADELPPPVPISDGEPQNDERMPAPQLFEILPTGDGGASEY